MPDFAIGDAFGIGMLTVLNDELFQQGLTQVDRRSIGDGDSTATTWREWAFGPMRFEGTVKHQDRKSIVEGQSVSVRVDRGGRRSIKKKRKTEKYTTRAKKKK